MSRSLALSLAVLATMSACQPRTELVIGVATDLAAPDKLDRVTLSLQRADDGVPLGTTDWEISGDRGEPFNLPGSFGVVSDGDPVRILATLEGSRAGDTLLARTAILSLVPEQTLFYRMTLVGSCIGRLDCPPTSDCVEGVCRDRIVEPTTMPDFDAELVTAVSCNGAIRYLDTSTGEALASTADAESCPPDRCVEGVCVKPPAATDDGRTITGSQITAFVGTAGAVLQVPDDLSAITVEVLEPREDGSYDVIAGAGRADGTFAISGVPAGDVIVHVGTRFVVTSGTSLDLGSVRLGPSVRESVADTDRILLNATGLEPWEDGDDLGLFATNDAYWFQDFSNPPAAGATQLVAQPLADVSFSSRIHADDAAIVTQYSQRATSGGLAYYAAVASGVVPSFEQAASGNTSISVPIVAHTPVSSTVAVDARAWEIVAGVNGTLAQNLGPSAQLEFGGVFFAAFAQPYGLVYGQFSSSPDEFYFNLPLGDDLAPSTFTYGQPRVGELEYATLALMGLNARVRYLVPGTTRAMPLFVGATQRDVLAAQHAAAPRLGPVTSPTIDSESLFIDAAIRDRAVLAWEPPVLGTARVYFVGIDLLRAQGTNTVFERVATFITPRNSLTIPRGLLVAGQHYAIRITATDGGNPDAPFRERATEASSTVASGLLTVEAP